MIKKPLFIVICIIFVCSAKGQVPYSDRAIDGLTGKVRTVTESVIEDKHDVILDTVKKTMYSHESIKIRRKFFIGRFLENHNFISPKFECRDKKTDSICTVKRDTVYQDTQYYYKADYSIDGFLLSRTVVCPGRHEYTVATYDNKKHVKVEMRTYCTENDSTTQWHYFYSKNADSIRLTQVLVTKFKGNESGQVVERIDYDYEDDEPICREKHYAPNDNIIKTIKYEDGRIMEIFYNVDGCDSNIHYYYADNGLLEKLEVCEKDYETIIRTETYSYQNNSYTVVLNVGRPKRNRNEMNKKEIKYTVDRNRNWTEKRIDNNVTQHRNIVYY